MYDFFFPGCAGQEVAAVIRPTRPTAKNTKSRRKSGKSLVLGAGHVIGTTVHTDAV